LTVHTCAHSRRSHPRLRRRLTASEAGERRQSSPNDVDRPYRPASLPADYFFTAKEFDPETGFYYFGARYLDPRFSKWMTADPALGDYLGNRGIHSPQNASLYAYGWNNPATLLDRDGRQSDYPKSIDDEYSRFVSSITLDQMDGRITEHEANLARQWAFLEREKAISWWRRDAIDAGIAQHLLEADIAGVLSKAARHESTLKLDEVLPPRRLGFGSLPERGAPVNNIAPQRPKGLEFEPLDPPGTLGAARVWTINGRLKSAGGVGLPQQGRIRYVPPKGYDPRNPLPRGPNNGYVDRFGNEWVKGPSRTAGEPVEWDVQLSPTGQAQLGWASRDGSHLNVSLEGRITHR
jgi:RHS repeat-associated protein